MIFSDFEIKILAKGVIYGILGNKLLKKTARQSIILWTAVELIERERLRIECCFVSQFCTVNWVNNSKSTYLKRSEMHNQSNCK